MHPLKRNQSRHTNSWVSLPALQWSWEDQLASGHKHSSQGGPVVGPQGEQEAGLTWRHSAPPPREPQKAEQSEFASGGYSSRRPPAGCSARQSDPARLSYSQLRQKTIHHIFLQVRQMPQEELHFQNNVYENSGSTENVVLESGNCQDTRTVPRLCRPTDPQGTRPWEGERILAQLCLPQLPGATCRS